MLVGLLVSKEALGVDAKHLLELFVVLLVGSGLLHVEVVLICFFLRHYEQFFFFVEEQVLCEEPQHAFSAI